MNRRRALVGTVAAAGALIAGAATTAAFADSGDGANDTDSTDTTQRPHDPGAARAVIKAIYQSQSSHAGGTWNSYVSVPDADGTLVAAVDDNSAESVEAYSVNKVPVAIAVLDKVDRGLLTLDHQIEVPADIVITDGDGIFPLDGAYPSTVTVGHALALLLSVSDDTCVRLCGLVAPAAEINQILVDKGFPNTQVEPVANPNRFYLGKTTPKEMHELFVALVNGTLLSADSTTYLLRILRSPVAFTDGIRREMSSAERARIATKAGWFDDGRNEAGIIFDTAGKPSLVYSLFAHGQSEADNFGATHPAVQARAGMGRVWFDALTYIAGDKSAHTMMAPAYHPSNGG